jgi:hypothetical protein
MTELAEGVAWSYMALVNPDEPAPSRQAGRESSRGLQYTVDATVNRKADLHGPLVLNDRSEGRHRHPPSTFLSKRIRRLI